MRSTGLAVSARGLRHLRQKHREQADGGEERADLIHEGDAHVIGDTAEYRGAKAADAEGAAEEGADRVGGKEDEEIQLRGLRRDVKFLDQVEDVIARQA